MRKADVALVLLATVSAALLAIGAVQLLGTTDADERGSFWVRIVMGVLLAAGAVWALGTHHWIVGAFCALLSAITPLAEGWSWAALLAIVVAVWSLARAWNELTYERKPSSISEP